MEKTLDNTSAAQAKEKISDIKIWGDGDTFKLICKASSEKEGWMKSTKAMQIDGVGCVVQVTTQQANPLGFPVAKRNADGKLETINISEVPSSFQYDYSEESINYVIAESVTFVPGVKIKESLDDNKNVVGRKLVPLSQ